MASGNLGSGIEGGLGGAAVGFAVGGPVGAAVGLLAGGAMGGLFGGSQTYGFSAGQLQDFYSMRMNQIKQFNSQYINAISQYQTQAQNLASETYNKFIAPGVMSSLAATGFDPTSGAMASALANTSEQMQAGLFNNVFNAQQNRMTSVNESQDSAYRALMGVGGQNFGTPQQPAWLQGLMGIGGAAVSRAGTGAGPSSGGGVSSAPAASTTPYYLAAPGSPSAAAPSGGGSGYSFAPNWNAGQDFNG